MADSEQDSTYDFAPSDNPPPPKPAAKPRANPPVPPTSNPSGGHSVKPAEKSADPLAYKTPDVQTERLCPYCGFKYVGKVKARCPQCAAAMDGPTDLFQFAEPAWVRRLALGAMVIALAIPAHVAGAVFKMIFSDEQQIKGVTHALAAMLLVMGVFMLTRSPATPAGPTNKAATWARLSAITGAVLWLILAAISFATASHGLVKTLVILTLLVHVVLAVSLGFFVAWLATRVPNDSLANHAQYGGGLAALGCVSLVIVQFLEVYTPAHLIIFMCSFPLIIALLVMFGWGTVTLLRLAGDLRACAQAGESIIAKRLQRQAAQRK